MNTGQKTPQLALAAKAAATLQLPRIRGRARLAEAAIQAIDPMPMTIFKAIEVLLALGLLGVGFYVLAKNMSLPVSFKSMDEFDAVGSIVRWASQQIPRDDGRQQALSTMRFLLVYSWSVVYRLRRISRSDLAVLAPFIDQVIEGKGPPLNLPAEYEDWRPALLSNFKARMQVEGL